MKKKTLLPLSFLLLLLTGCAARPQTAADGQSWQEDWTTIGNRIGIEPSEQLTLLDSKEALAADGLYYATWTDGDCVPYENSDGDTVDLYDAQLYFLTEEADSEESAQDSCDTWLAAAKGNYDVTAEETITCNGQDYTLITYDCVSEDNPYDHGVSAFTVYEDMAVCAELTCLEHYTENPETLLTAFLNGCHYSAH